MSSQRHQSFITFDFIVDWMIGILFAVRVLMFESVSKLGRRLVIRSELFTKFLRFDSGYCFGISCVFVQAFRDYGHNYHQICEYNSILTAVHRHSRPSNKFEKRSLFHLGKIVRKFQPLLDNNAVQICNSWTLTISNLDKVIKELKTF